MASPYIENPAMKVNIAVCGKFHYHNYIKYIYYQEVLGRFLYSHRITTGSSSLSVPAARLVNIWIKEYLVRAHLSILNWRGAEKLFPIYHDLWDGLALLSWQSCDILHVMLHGTARRLIRKAKQGGGVIIGEPVNSHPLHMQALLREEYERLGIQQALTLQTPQRRLIEEVEMCDHLLVASHFLKNSFIREGYPAHRIHVLPYGVDLSRFYPASKEEKSASEVFRVICVAQISPRKGHIDLLEAWRLLNLPKADLIFIGAVHKDMKPILSKYDGLFKHIYSVPNIRLQEYYARASVFVLPSVEDGFAYVCTEAMACGLPIITTTNVGAAELIEHGLDGFIVPIRSPESIAYNLEVLYRDEERRYYMAEAASQKARTCLSWKQYADRLGDLYRSLSSSMKQEKGSEHCPESMSYNVQR
jgi:glycosyltransferase involved in cell wall biosynthesis